MCDNHEVHLFYYGKVYSRSTGSGIEDLPKCPQAQYFPIWALIDADLQRQGPPFSRGSNIWPIQASSPNSARWETWSKQYGAAMLGMPLWNIEELMEGYVFSLFSLSAIDPGHVFCPGTTTFEADWANSFHSLMGRRSLPPTTRG